MSNIRNRTVSFNLDSPRQKELSDYADRMSPTNFSDFIKSVLEWHKNINEAKENSPVKKKVSNQDKEAVASIL